MFYWNYISQRGFPSVEPTFRGRAIICPMIDGASAVSLSIPQGIAHLAMIKMHMYPKVQKKKIC